MTKFQIVLTVWRQEQSAKIISQSHRIFIGEIGYDEDVLPVGHWLLNDTIRNINFDPVLLFGFIL
jgi:hypothetical protein